MKEFIVRLFSLLAIVGVLFGYNEVLDVRAKDEEIAKLNAQLEVCLLYTSPSPRDS